MVKKILAEIKIDEDAMLRNCESNGIAIDDDPVNYLRHEFGWLEQSGITLESAKLEEPSEWEPVCPY